MWIGKPYPLVVLVKPTYGGFHSYVTHLYKGLEGLGVNPVIIQPAKRTENRMRDFGNGLYYQNMSELDCAQFIEQFGGLVACIWSSNQKIGTLSLLMSAGASLVLHDPTEYYSKPDVISAIKNNPQSKIITIRKSNSSLLRSEFDIPSHFIPHPYSRPEIGGDLARSRRGVSFSRIDFDKHTEIIACANQNLPDSGRIAIYGYINRLYEYHKLNETHPNWKAEYHGVYPSEFGAAVRIARTAHYAVDMSEIKKDGGGTQYTFLEAWDAGVALVLNSAWVTAGGVMEHGLNCYTVSDGETLATQILQDPDPNIVATGREMLKTHDAKTIAKDYMELLS